MALTIDLTSEEEAHLSAVARQKGIRPQELARELLINNLPPLSEERIEEDPTLALFAEWEKEDAQMTHEEMERESRLWEEFERNVNETRRSLGMRTL
jgi:hypothetical protein